MTFSVGTITRCAGQNHYSVPVTIAGQQFVIPVLQDDLATDFQGVTDARDRIVDRLRSARKEAGAVTFAATKTALEGKSFQI